KAQSLRHRAGAAGRRRGNEWLAAGSRLHRRAEPGGGPGSRGRPQGGLAVCGVALCAGLCRGGLPADRGKTMGGGCAVAALSGRIKGAALLLAALTLAGCQVQVEADPPTPAPTAAPAAEPAEPVYDVTPGSETYRDFTLDNIYHS